MPGTRSRERSAVVLAGVMAALIAFPATAQPPPPAPPPPPDKDAPIECEFRVFDGEDEISADISIRIFRTGTREGAMPVEPANGRLTIHVPPAIYDVQIVRMKQGQVSSIRWSEGLVIVRYPDENGRHLEVINFRPRYGALQVISVDGGEFDMAAMPPGTREAVEPQRRVAGRIVKGAGYQLFVAIAGRYDVRIRKPGAEERWLLDIEIPAERTRLKTVDGG